MIEDNVEWTYNLTVPANDTKRLATFTVLGTTRLQAIDAANALVTAGGFGGQAAAFLTSTEIASLANFEFGSLDATVDVSGNLTVTDTRGVANELTLNTDGTTHTLADTNEVFLAPPVGWTRGLEWQIDLTGFGRIHW